MDAVQKCSLLLSMSRGLSLCVFVGHSREPCRTAEPIEMPFGLWTLVGPRNHVLGWGPSPRQEKGNFGGACPTPL